MEQFIYITLHESADRLAREAAREAAAGNEADCYIKAYQKVISFLISEHQKQNTAEYTVTAT